MIYSATAKGPYKMPGYHDPNNKRFVGVVYRPATWQADTIYYLRGSSDYDVVTPTTFNGFYYKVTNPGKSHATTEPTWPTTVGETVDDNGIIWEAVAYNLLPASETIVTSTWAATESVTISGGATDGISTTIMITAVPAGVETFDLTNHIVKSNDEEEDVTLQFKVGAR